MSLLSGVLDTHVHAGPEVFGRIGDAIDFARSGVAKGMRGIVFKAHHESTVTRALMAKKVVPGIELYGSLALNSFTGGFNVYFVAQALAAGARYIWMPTIHARHHIQLIGAGSYGIPSMTLGANMFDRDGLSIFDGDGKVLPAVKDIVAMAKERDVPIGTGHISEDEIFALQRICNDIGTRMCLTHAFFPRGTLDFVKQVSDGGAYVELSAVVAYPMSHHFAKGMELRDVAAVFAAVPEDRIVISTDAGQIHNPEPVVLLETFLKCVRAIGVPQQSIDFAIRRNPARLIGVDE
jgi:hypothetical protein